MKKSKKTKKYRTDIFMINNLSLRFSTKPSKQLLWFWMMKDMRLSAGKNIGIDAACGSMRNRPGFRTNHYIGIDIDQERLDIGIEQFPEARAICNRIEDVEGIKGDFLVCVQAFHNKHFDSTKLLQVVQHLPNMLNPEGILIFNIGKKNIPFENEIDNFLSTKFKTIQKKKYGRFSSDMNMLSPFMAMLMYFLPWLRRRRSHSKVYYVCKGKV